MQAQCSQNLGFFPPHDIRRAGFALAGQARQDGYGAAIRLKAQGRIGNRRRLSGAFQIRHFPPADGRTHHTGQHGGQLAMRLVPGGDSGGKAHRAIWRRRALAFSARQDIAASIAKIKPEPAGAPVPCNKCRLAHGGLLHVGLVLVEQPSQLVLGFFQRAFAGGRQILAGAVDIESQHRHGRPVR